MTREEMQEIAAELLNKFDPDGKLELSKYEKVVYCSGVIDAIKYVDEHPANPWISVKDRLPEKDGDNISIPVAAITNIGYWFKGQYDYDNKDWFFSEEPDILDFEEGEFVTHWMPLPETPKGGNV